MAQLEGITVERAHAGHPACIKFDYNKYAGLLQQQSIKSIRVDAFKF